MSWNPTKKQRLLDIASRWDGHISVAVYIEESNKTENANSETTDTIKDIINFLESHNDLFQSKVGCHLVVDRRDKNGLQESFYPHNLLRNIAVENAMTDYVLHLDVDFVPSENAHDTLVEHIQRFDAERQSTQALVLPAFEYSLAYDEDELTVTATDLPKTKTDLVGFR